MSASAMKKLGRHEGLDRYMSDVRRFKLLSREEEQTLALRWADEQDVDAAHALVTSNLRFVVKVALEYRSYGLRVLDLVQEGNVGLMHAVRKFDPRRGYRLITYAVWWIRAYIQSYLLRAWSLVKIGTTQAQRRLFFKLSSARAQLEQSTWEDALTEKERHDQLAAQLGVRPEDISQMERRLAARDFSLDLTLDETGETTHLDMLESDEEPTEALVARRQIEDALREELAAAMKILTPREREVITLRYLDGDAPTLKEVGERWGVSRERARQIEAQAREKLKRHLERSSRALEAALAQ